MRINKLEGTPWHIERFHRKEYDDRRHKSRCKYYTKEKCTKLGHRCYGSAHCLYYVESKDKVTVNPGKCKTRMMIPYGEFKVMYLEDELVIKKVIGKNSEGKYIAEDAPLTQEVLKHEVGSTFKVNDEEVKLLNKNIQYK